jgi:NAD(P)-dependent dehydrogenase (short-subunit alcohol dehydrogenase family)
MEMKGRVALVTGAGGGIGRATCLEFARAGAKVAAVDIDAERGEQTVAEVARAGGDARFWPANTTRAAEVKRYVEGTVGAFGRIDVFFNNAGVPGPIVSMVDYPDDVFEQVIAVNLNGVFLGLKYVLQVMVAQKSGSIVNMSSAAGLLGFSGFAGYCASKHGVIGLTRSAAAEFGSIGIRVNAVCPGVINTAMMRTIETAMNPMNPSAVVEQFAAVNPAHRYGEPEEIARVVVFLGSDSASFVNGAVWTVDGGVTAI